MEIYLPFIFGTYAYSLGLLTQNGVINPLLYHSCLKIRTSDVQVEVFKYIHTGYEIERIALTKCII